jgi:hypothetical protein
VVDGKCGGGLKVVEWMRRSGGGRGAGGYLMEGE